MINWLLCIEILMTNKLLYFKIQAPVLYVYFVLHKQLFVILAQFKIQSTRISIRNSSREFEPALWYGNNNEISIQRKFKSNFYDILQWKASNIFSFTNNFNTFLD